MQTAAEGTRALDDIVAITGGTAVLTPGTPVEVRQRFDFSWARGFEVAEVVPAGYRVRRRSDGVVLPADFVFDDVRPEGRRTGW